MANEPITGLPYQEANMLQTDVLQNEQLNYFAAWSNAVVQTVGDNSPPGSPTNGHRYVIGTSPTGAWSGKAKYLAVYRGGWQFYAPHEGARVTNIADGKIYVYSASAWVEYTIPAPAPTINIVTTIASGTITPAGDTDLVRPAALSAALTIANPSSTPADGAGFVVDLIDNGTTRALTWGTKYASRMATLPTATTAGKRHRIGVEYNAADDKLYCMYAQVQA